MYPISHPRDRGQHLPHSQPVTDAWDPPPSLHHHYSRMPCTVSIANLAKGWQRQIIPGISSLRILSYCSTPLLCGRLSDYRSDKGYKQFCDCLCILCCCWDATVISKHDGKFVLTFTTMVLRLKVKEVPKKLSLVWLCLFYQMEHPLQTNIL